MTKWCPRCQDNRPIGEFYKNKTRYDGLSGFCVACQRQADIVTQRAKRSAFILAMGDCCERCGFSDPRALQIDHLNGNGATERRIARSGTARFYAKVLADRSEYALLCANCNQIKKCEQNETVGSRVYTRMIPTNL